MTNAEKFQLCLERAKRIVRAYRDDAPRGCDPMASWVAVVGTVASVGIGAYSASQQKKAASKAQSGGPTQLPEFQEKTAFPNFIPYDTGQLQNIATTGDKQAFAASDADFAARHPQVVGAEKALQNQTTKDWMGSTEFMPQMQATALQSGLEGATGSMGPITSTLAPNSGAEADVAKNLGLDIMGFQQQNRANRMGDLSMEEQIFPRRQIGLTGQDMAQIGMLDTAGQNQYDQSKYANQLGIDQFNYLAQTGNTQALAQQQNANQLASAQAQSGIWNGVFNSLGGLLKGSGAMAGNKAATPGVDPATVQAGNGALNTAQGALSDELFGAAA